MRKFLLIIFTALAMTSPALSQKLYVGIGYGLDMDCVDKPVLRNHIMDLQFGGFVSEHHAFELDASYGFEKIGMSTFEALPTYMFKSGPFIAKVGIGLKLYSFDGYSFTKDALALKGGLGLDIPLNKIINVYILADINGAYLTYEDIWDNPIVGLSIGFRFNIIK